jgi:hypothetical protein
MLAVVSPWAAGGVFILLDKEAYAMAKRQLTHTVPVHSSYISRWIKLEYGNHL